MARISKALGRNSLVYQIYPRSFADANGDGNGDLIGVISKLDYLLSLGVDAIWLSPIFQSPMRDMGYDVSDYCDIDPMFGSVEDAERLIEEAHARDIGVLFDIVPSHTSIDHPWFRTYPDRYIWHDGDAPPNNWASVFGGPAWTRDEHTGRWYLHTFYRHQPQLNWRNPEVIEAIAGVMRFWLDKGIDGFRMDALQCMFVDEQLRDEPVATAPILTAAAHVDWLRLEHIYTFDQPEIAPTLAKLAEMLPDTFLVAEVYTGIQDLAPYVEAVGHAFCFSLTNVAPSADVIRGVIEEAARVEGLAWALSNHDISRLATRWGAEWTQVAAMLVSTLPGCCFIYQGDEIGMSDGPGVDPPFDLIGRDAYRHPMQWEGFGGFTTGDAWLPMANPERLNVAGQHDDDWSLLNLYRRLFVIRREMEGPLEILDSEPDVLAFRRGDHVVALNFGDGARRGPAVAEVLCASHDGTGPESMLPASGYVGRLS
jgi:alpha-glucosidase